jgi:hypothetical protein
MPGSGARVYNIQNVLASSNSLISDRELYFDAGRNGRSQTMCHRPQTPVYPQPVPMIPRPRPIPNPDVKNTRTRPFNPVPIRAPPGLVQKPRLPEDPFSGAYPDSQHLPPAAQPPQHNHSPEQRPPSNQQYYPQQTPPSHHRNVLTLPPPDLFAPGLQDPPQQLTPTPPHKQIPRQITPPLTQHLQTTTSTPHFFRQHDERRFRNDLGPPSMTRRGNRQYSDSDFYRHRRNGHSSGSAKRDHRTLH